MAIQDRARALADQVDGPKEWRIGQDVLAMYCYTYLGEFTKARQIASTAASAPSSPPPVTDVLCPGITSQVALAEGALAEAATLAHDAIAAPARS